MLSYIFQQLITCQGSKANMIQEIYMKMFHYMILQLNGKGNDVEPKSYLKLYSETPDQKDIQSTISSHSLLRKLSTGQAQGNNIELMCFVLSRPCYWRIGSSPSYKFLPCNSHKIFLFYIQKILASVCIFTLQLPLKQESKNKESNRAFTRVMIFIVFTLLFQ